LEARYSGDTIIKTGKPPPVPWITSDRSVAFNGKKLSGTRVIADTLTTTKKQGSMVYDSIGVRAWHKMFGYGYMCISYPQYNANTKILVLREWIENYDWCGTGRESVFHYKRIAGGWKAY
jgi:hypothetical protein